MARRAILEMTGVIILTPLFDVAAGTLVEPHISRFALYPALLVMFTGVPTVNAPATTVSGAR